MKIFLIGLMGSGKSFLGKKISKSINLPFIDLDDEI
jgi:shikimate kinase